MSNIPNITSVPEVTAKRISDVTEDLITRLKPLLGRSGQRPGLTRPEFSIPMTLDLRLLIEECLIGLVGQSEKVVVINTEEGVRAFSQLPIKVVIIDTKTERPDQIQAIETELVSDNSQALTEAVYDALAVEVSSGKISPDSINKHIS